MLGSLILWFGWYGFNAGSALKVGADLNAIVIAKAVANTALAGGSSGVTALLVNLFVTERKTGEPVYKLSAAMNGCLTGLAAITGSCGIIEPWAALLIGMVAGLLYLATSNMLEKACIDDAVDAIPVHLAGGSWGVIATGLLVSPQGLRELYGASMEHVGWFYSWGRGSADFKLMACQIVGLLCILFWTFSVMTPFFVFLNYMGMLRSDSLEEIVGLDISYHGYTPQTNDADVSNEDLQEYYRKNKRYEKIVLDEENDVDNVDRFE
jgi:Amt family ammonium transporter